MYQIKYDCPGSLETVKLIQQLDSAIKLDTDWGLDHGAWTVLVHIYPEADIPVIEISVDNSMPV